MDLSQALAHRKAPGRFATGDRGDLEVANVNGVAAVGLRRLHA
jgi:hypothetical protein